MTCSIDSDGEDNFIINKCFVTDESKVGTDLQTLHHIFETFETNIRGGILDEEIYKKIFEELSKRKT